jgi:hypothetical protein
MEEIIVEKIGVDIDKDRNMSAKIGAGTEKRKANEKSVVRKSDFPSITLSEGWREASSKMAMRCIHENAERASKNIKVPQGSFSKIQGSTDKDATLYDIRKKIEKMTFTEIQDALGKKNVFKLSSVRSKLSK